MFILYLLISLCTTNVVFGDDPLVTLPMGQIRGYTKTSAGGRTINAFEGVPYAKPPTCGLRFEEPQPPDNWTGIWEARTQYYCMQYNQHAQSGEDWVIGDEDCLYLNIYSPNLTANLNVLVFIHGGTFPLNYGAGQGPEMLLDNDIVYVSINYRLGTLGFLCTEDDVIPGNNGLKDQIQALKWIKQYIKNFGGNPKSVTLYGVSLGAISVEYHYLMPQSKQLFHRGISESGTALMPVSLQEKLQMKTKILAENLGCPTDNSRAILDCLKSRPAKQVVHGVRFIRPYKYTPFVSFGAVSDTWAKTPVLPDHPYNLLKNNKVADLPWIAMYVSDEGLYPCAGLYNKDDELKDLDTRWNEIAPHLFDYNNTIEPKKKDSVSKNIKDQYFRSEPVSTKTFSNLVDAVGDRIFKVDLENSCRLHSAAVRSKVYALLFAYRGANSRTNQATHSNVSIGVAHGDILNYIFKTDIDTLSTENDREMSKIMVKMVISYMNDNEPSLPIKDWQPVSKRPKDAFKQVVIQGPSNINMQDKESLGNSKFWGSLPIQENEKISDNSRFGGWKKVFNWWG